MNSRCNNPAVRSQSIKNVSFEVVLEKLINEDKHTATALLHEWFVEQCKCINNELDNVVEDPESEMPLDSHMPALPVAIDAVDHDGPPMGDLPLDVSDEVEVSDFDSADLQLQDRIEDLEAEVFGNVDEEESDESDDEESDDEESDDLDDEKVDEDETVDSDEDETVDESFDFSDLEENFSYYDGPVSVPS